MRDQRGSFNADVNRGGLGGMLDALFGMITKMITQIVDTIQKQTPPQTPPDPPTRQPVVPLPRTPDGYKQGDNDRIPQATPIPAQGTAGQQQPTQ